MPTVSSVRVRDRKGDGEGETGREGVSEPPPDMLLRFTATAAIKDEPGVTAYQNCNEGIRTGGVGDGTWPTVFFHRMGLSSYLWDCSCVCYFFSAKINFMLTSPYLIGVRRFTHMVLYIRRIRF